MIERVGMIMILAMLGATAASCSKDSDFEDVDAGDTDTTDDVCARWLSVRADLSEGSWDGDVDSCAAGDVAGGGRDRALAVLNLYRWLAGQPEVENDPTRDAAAQECALMMHAAEALSHSPDSSWPCYTAQGADAAGSSNIATAPGVSAIDLYMIDPGNENTLGHRRWLLSNSLGPVGLGSTDAYSCAWVLGGSGAGDADWISWPPPGEVPFEIVAPGGSFSSLDETGWSIQSDTIDLSLAAIEVDDGQEVLPVTTTALSDGYGSFHAIGFVPDGWQAEVGATYTVSVTAIASPFSYDVTFVSCD